MHNNYNSSITRAHLQISAASSPLLERARRQRARALNQRSIVARNAIDATSAARVRGFITLRCVGGLR